MKFLIIYLAFFSPALFAGLEGERPYGRGQWLTCFEWRPLDSENCLEINLAYVKAIIYKGEGIVDITHSDQSKTFCMAENLSEGRRCGE